MGVYYLYAIDHNGRPAYQHKSGLDYLFYAEGNAWVIGAQVGFTQEPNSQGVAMRLKKCRKVEKRLMLSLSLADLEWG